jgi:hypothetical protein
MSIKRFEESKPVEIELVTADGKARRFKAKSLTPAILREYLAISKEKPDPEKPMRICRQMALIFGGVPEDFDNYEIWSMKSALQYLQEVPADEDPTQTAEPEPGNALQN